MKTLRRTLFLINILALTVLSFFAKDNLIAAFSDFPHIKNVPIFVEKHGSIEVIFSPNNGATKAIVKAISSAKKTIFVSAYSFTSQELAQALLDAKKRNVAVKLILDKSQLSQRYSSSTFFANLGFDLRIDVKHAIYHNKIMIIDDDTVITGSFNFTKAAESKNAENLLIIRNNQKLAQIYQENFWFHWHQSLSKNEFERRKMRK